MLAVIWDGQKNPLELRTKSVGKGSGRLRETVGIASDLLAVIWDGQKNPLELRKKVLARVQGDLKKLLALLLICWQSFGIGRKTRWNFKKKCWQGYRETYRNC